jgi:DMSO/TMAO reductase YedYZ molybdopterin-dependent catalytic subunit
MEALVNHETPLAKLVGGVAMPTALFYIRNHFPIPARDPARWRLHVGGLVRRQLSLTLQELLRMPSEVRAVTLECAGNGRALLQPRVGGEQWGLGAVSTAEWAGVPLLAVLNHAGVNSAAKAIVFKGADGFERGLTLAEARESEALVAYAMNGELLPREHGRPLRLIVGGWYAVASVKWLTEIEVTDQPFNGHFQTEKYVYQWERDGDLVSEPVRHQRVRALISEPAPDAVVAPGEVPLRGYAWSGEAPIKRVDVSVDDGCWQPARLLGAPDRYCWRRWELIARLGPSRRVTVRARAIDEAGNTQPEQVEWNRLGYGNNAIQEVALRISRSVPTPTGRSRPPALPAVGAPPRAVCS